MSEEDYKESYRKEIDYWRIQYSNLQEEIERLNNKVEELMTLYTTEREVKEDYKSIIKEVREYIDKFIKANYEDVFNQEQKEYMVKILQMLDKENKDGER